MKAFRGSQNTTKVNSQTDKCNFIFQKIDQRSKTNNCPVSQIIVQNYVQLGPNCEDTQALVKLREQLAQLSTQHDQKSAKIETMQLESGRKNTKINNLISEKNHVLTDLADKDRIIEEQANALIQREKAILELQEKMRDLFEELRPSKQDKKIQQYEAEIDEFVVLEPISHSIDDFFSDFVIMNTGSSIAFE